MRVETELQRWWPCYCHERTVTLRKNLLADGMALEIAMKKNLVNTQRMSVGWNIPGVCPEGWGLVMVKYG